MKKEDKRLARDSITFEGMTDQNAVILAQVGIGNKEIRRQTGFTDSQVTYRLSKAKRLLEHKHGFRVDWRNGNHPLLERILKDYAAIMVKEIEHDLVPKIIVPTPKVAKVKIKD